MQDIAIIGASYRTLGMEELGRLQLDKAELRLRLRTLAARLELPELIYLGTCNRLELIVRVPPGLALEALRPRVFEALAGRAPCVLEAERSFRIWAGESALEHLLMVACGLDSARVGDREIANQLRDAWLAARAAGVCGARLDAAVAVALAAAREARADEADQGRAKGLAERAAGHALRCVEGRGEAVALVGVSPMTRAAGRALRQQGVPLVVVNRSAEARTQLATELGARAATPQELWSGALRVGALISAVGAAEPIADVAALRAAAAAAGGRLLVVDLGVPANVPAACAAEAGVDYVGMDHMIGAAAAERPAELLERSATRAIVDRHLDCALAAAAERAAGPVIGALRSSFEARLEAELRELLGGELSGLAPAERAVLERWTGTLARRMAHVPMRGLRSIAAGGDLHSVELCVEAMTRALEEQRTTR